MFLDSKALQNRLVNCAGKLFTSEKDIRQLEYLLQQLKRFDAMTLLNIASAHGVTPQVYHNLQTLKAQGFKISFLDAFLVQARRDLEKMKAYQEKLFADLELFAKAAEGASSRFMVVKGACFRDLYPTESFRPMFDIDLVVSADVVWEVIDAFKQIGYRPKRIRLESYPYSVEHPSGIFGIAEMLELDGDPRIYPFDLHLGAFPGCGDGLLDLDIWQRARSLKVGGREVLMPSLEDCLLIICSHISRHGYAKLKDLNDTSACLTHAGDSLDWDYLSHFAKKNSLQSIFYGLIGRLTRDCDVKLPHGVLSRLKPKGLGNLTSKVLFSIGRENSDFHGGRQLVSGRFLQSSFLYNYYQDRVGFSTALKKAISGLYFLFQSGRPYQLWKSRKIQSFRSNRRIVIIPIKATTSEVCWCLEKIHFLKVEQFALKSGVSVEWIGNEIIVWNVGHPNELILTPEGFYTQSAYNGGIDEVVLEDIQRVACEVIVQLKQAEAIQAKRVKACSVAADVSINGG